MGCTIKPDIRHMTIDSAVTLKVGVSGNSSTGKLFESDISRRALLRRALTFTLLALEREIIFTRTDFPLEVLAKLFIIESECLEKLSHVPTTVTP